MASIPTPGWRKIQIPRPLQQLFDRFPLLTYEPNDLPERSRQLTSSDLPTLYVFSTDEDARQGLPSFNPGCLKWQTLLRLANFTFRVLPSTNHASPTGSLPFLLPPRTSPTTSPLPIPSDKLLAYAIKNSIPDSPAPAPAPDLPLRSQAYLSLITLSLRNAWLYALYLEPTYAPLLHKLYICPASSSRAVQKTLLYQLRRAAAEQIATSSSSTIVSASAVSSAEGIDEEAVYDAAKGALAALAGLLSQSESGWAFGAEKPTAFDAALFSYTHLMMEYMGEEDATLEKGRMALGRMVREAGNGELARHREKMLAAAWPGWDRKSRT
ncbi:hypothetical protein VTI74DRAFT_5553 [Chaetomium olivicolor]